MKSNGSTLLPTIRFESIGPHGHCHTIVVRATVDIVPGGLSTLAEKQLPLNLTDQYFGNPVESSLKYPSDLAPFKPKADIILVATAYPPNVSSLAWNVGVTVGRHRKTLAATGPRFWKKGLFGWSPSALEPATKLPIRYENAYGGAHTVLDKQGEPTVIDLCRSNPVGKGWLSPIARRTMGDIKTLPAAQFYSKASDLPPVFGREYAVEGFGAIAPTWSSRQRYVGTGEKSAAHCADPASLDIHPLFYNCAHPDLVVPYLTGDETVQLLNLTPDEVLEFQLPGKTVQITAQFGKPSESVPVPAFLDTLIIEPDDLRATMVWRSTIPVEANPEKIEARIVSNEKTAEKETDHE